MSINRPVRFWLLIVSAIIMVGCEEESTEAGQILLEEADPAVRITEIPIDRNDPSPVSGRYEVVDFQLSAVAAMDENEAMDWLGQLLIVSEGAVGAAGEVCPEPGFEVHTELFPEYFSVFETNYESLGLLNPEVEMISVLCDSEPWQGAGGEFIRISGDTILTVYDGVFMRLEPY